MTDADGIERLRLRMLSLPARPAGEVGAACGGSESPGGQAFLVQEQERERRHRCAAGRAGSSGVENTMMKRVVERVGLR
jgi:hypothetical protein